MLKEIFDSNKNIVINTDIDGFLCGMILQKYYGCKVVGFSNSSDKVWVDTSVADIDTPIYIDMFVAKPNVICIDQHIIAYNKEHYDEIVSLNTKINPNIDRKRTFVGDLEGDYFHKYPFGTVHYIIYLMAKEGISVELPDLTQPKEIHGIINQNYRYKTSAGHILLRADDALYTSLLAYPDNAKDWWDWLDHNHQYPAIEKMRQFINTCDSKKSEEYKTVIGNFFRSLGCSGIDGAFVEITNKNGVLFPIVNNYIRVIGQIMEMELDVPLNYTIHTGTPLLKQISKLSGLSSIKENGLYSYAIKGSPSAKSKNFSYTINMK